MSFINRPRVVINGTRRTRTYRFFWCRQCDRTVRIASANSSTFVCPFCYNLLFQEFHLPRSSSFPSHNSSELPTSSSSSSSSSSPSPAQLIDTMSQIINMSSQPRPAPLPPQENTLSNQPEPSDQAVQDQTNENRTRSGITEFKMTADTMCTEPPCPICKEDFVVNEHITKLGCNHLYHSDCITPWLQINSTCPVCRYELPTQQGCTHHDHNNRARSSSSNSNNNNFRAANYGHDYEFYGDFNLRFEEVMNLSIPSWAELFSILWPFRLGALLDWSFSS